MPRFFKAVKPVYNKAVSPAKETKDFKSGGKNDDKKETKNGETAPL